MPASTSGCLDSAVCRRLRSTPRDSLTAFDSAGGIRPATDPYGRSLGYVNGSGGFSRGLEFGLDARPSRPEPPTSYTFTDAETKQDITVPGFFLCLASFGTWRRSS